jgi:hypothetical protein
MAALERLAHEIHVADAFEAVVGATIGEAHEMLHEISGDFLRIHEVRHAELLGERLAPRVDVNANDLGGPASRAPWITLRPMPPRPNTTTFAPGSTLAVLITAPIPVVTPQPM